MSTFTIKLKSFTVWAILIVCSLQPKAQTIAFPGAEGAGRFASGGRGTAAQPTTVFEVTNLNDDDKPGSLRYAIEAAETKYPWRTIVFRVSGTVHLNAKLSIRSNTTIAGQTAPGGGICLADHPVSISGDNVIVRYLRIRMGDKNQNKGKIDGSGGDDAFGNVSNKNIIIDHCSISWSSDEALTIYAQLSQQNIPQAMFQYANLALQNKNSNLDCAQAFNLLKMASDKDYLPAKTTLGFLYAFADNDNLMKEHNYFTRCSFVKNAYKGAALLTEATMEGDFTAAYWLDKLNNSGK